MPEASFVDDDALRRIADAGLSDRLLFGSDMPVYAQWHRGGYSAYVTNRVVAICNIFKDDAERILSGNFDRFFLAE